MLLSIYSGRGVTANIHDLGSCDSGFESQRSDNMVFIKNKEDFVCDNCGYKNIGNGYTNHCSICLFSKHVDIDPGDRLNTCGGLMKPEFVSYTNKDKYVIQRCLTCLFERKNILNDNDSLDTMIKVQNSDK